jgi:hypothetical protein
MSTHAAARECAGMSKLATHLQMYIVHLSDSKKVLTAAVRIAPKARALRSKQAVFKLHSDLYNAVWLVIHMSFIPITTHSAQVDDWN